MEYRNVGKENFLSSFPLLVNTSFKSLYKTVSEHKDVLKMVSMLSTIISSSKIEASKVLDVFNEFKKLWEEVNRHIEI